MDSVIRHLILAAGEGRRMGGSKALARFENRTFLEAVLDAGRRAGLAPAVVVTAHEADRVERVHAGAGCVFVRNPDPSDGPISSIRAALHHDEITRAAGLLIHPVDHPLVRPATLRRILERFTAGGAALVVPTHGGRGGHPTLFARQVYPELADVPAGEGARLVVRRDPSRVARLAVDDPGVRRNLDTPADLDRPEASEHPA